MVKAKFQVASITDYGQQKEVKLTAVVGVDDDNAQWSKYTPSGELRMSITNPDAFNQFEVGKAYIISFEGA